MNKNKCECSKCRWCKIWFIWILMLENWNVFVWNRFDLKVWDWFKLAVVNNELLNIEDNNEEKRNKWITLFWLSKEEK